MRVIAASLDDAPRMLAAEIQILEIHGRRTLVGIAGGPGSGKSTLTERVVAELNRAVPGIATAIPMDGFHMREAELRAVGLSDRKGAPETFRASAFVEFLRHISSATKPVAGPIYSRKIEEVVDGGYVIGPTVRHLVVEGNYLLLDRAPWDEIGPLLDLSVFLRVPREIVSRRLLRRHTAEGLFTAERNARHVENVDLPNYDLVALPEPRADIVLNVSASSPSQVTGGRRR